MTTIKQHKHITLALDLEGTLISHASTMIPRPGLFEFLTFCKEHFERIVFFSFVEEERGRAILAAMADSGYMPDWVHAAEYFHARGGRPGAKDLRQLGVEPEQALLVDDQPQVLPREQLHRLVQVPEFREPFDNDDSVLKHAQTRMMEKFHQIWIYGDYEITDKQSTPLTHAIIISNPETTRRPPVNFTGDCLHLCFGDVVSPQDAAQCRTKAANLADIRQAVIFYRVARLQKHSSLLVSCDYGASRSPALAYVLLADLYGAGRESEALKSIIGIRPESVPNRLVVELGDILLDRNGALRAALKEYYQQLDFSC